MTTPNQRTDLEPAGTLPEGPHRRPATADQRYARPLEEYDDPDRGETSDGEREPLLPRQRVDEYTAIWDSLKGSFVDEPRRAVDQADQLVSELLDELQRLFHNQRQNLERDLDADETSTEDLRIALRRYRSFFDRLLSV